MNKNLVIQMDNVVSLFPEPSKPESPLCSIAAEQNLLGLLMRNSELYYKISGFLKQEHFFEETHGRIFRAISILIDRGAIPSPVTMRNYFEKDQSLSQVGGADYLVYLAGLSPIPDAKGFANIIHDLAVRRIAIKELEQTVSKLRDVQVDATAEEILCEQRGKLENMVSWVDHALQTEKQVAIEIYESLDRPSKFDSTGIPVLDSAMAGGLYAGCSYAFAARKKTGKTALACTISRNLSKRGAKHLFISLEMNPLQIEQRLLAREMQCAYVDFMSSERQSPAFRDRVAKVVSETRQNILYHHSPGISFDKLRSLISSARMRQGINGFILDYSQLVTGKTRSQTFAEFMDELAQWISNYCRREGIWSLVLAQLNQENGNIRGGEGLRLAFDQVYSINKCKEHVRNGFYLEQMDTRYTPWHELGTDEQPSLMMSDYGPHFYQIGAYD